MDIGYYEGIGRMYCAVMTVEETLSTPAQYGAVRLMGEGIAYKIAPKYIEGKLPASNRYLRDKRKLVGYEVEINVARVLPDVLADIEGRVRDGNGVSKIGAGDPPYLALVFEVPLDDGNSELWQIYKGKLLSPDRESKTREDKLEWGSHTLKGEFMSRLDLGVPAVTCEMADETVSEAVREGWFETIYAPTAVVGLVQVLAPSALTVTEGDIGIDAVLTVGIVATNGGTVTYQWYKSATNTNAGGTLLAGATGAGYQIPADTAAGTHYYYCVGTYQDVTLASDVATVTVEEV